VGQAEAQALLQGHPLSPKREKGLRQVLSRHMELGVYGGLDSSTLVDALVRLLCRRGVGCSRVHAEVWLLRVVWLLRSGCAGAVQLITHCFHGWRGRLGA
jgi:hypothetical protein